MKRLLIIALCLLSISSIKPMIQNNGANRVTLYVGAAQQEVRLQPGESVPFNAAGNYNLIIERFGGDCPGKKYGFVGGLRPNSLVSIAGDTITEMSEGAADRSFSVAGQCMPWGHVKKMGGVAVAAPIAPVAAPAAQVAVPVAGQRKFKKTPPGHLMHGHWKAQQQGGAWTPPGWQGW